MYAAAVICALSIPVVDKPYQPVIALDGSHSQIRKERFVHLLTAEEWTELWSEHRGKKQPYTETSQSPNINFKTHYAVAVFAGPCDFCSPQYCIRGEEVVIRYHPDVPQTEGGPLGGKDPTPEVLNDLKKREA
jgi:hypothetical protein